MFLLYSCLSVARPDCGPARGRRPEALPGTAAATGCATNRLQPMAAFQYLALLSTAAATAVGGRPDTLGPGAGPWTVASPDSVGLDAEKLRQAEETVNARVGGRTCFVVVKDGKIVHETYRGSGGVDVISEGYSTTKSQCSTLFGIAREQGWASPFESIASRNSGTRQCNADAEFRHSLSMTGQSANLDSPTFSYDTLGTQCLDTISDFIDENNPDGLNAEEWKDRYWQQPLGLEHSRWVGGSGLACGTSSVVSCRDLARTALVWANDGQWPEEGQMVRRNIASACPPVIDITACDVDRCYTHPSLVCLLIQGAYRPVGA
eukprot:COSAG01_NODE_1351_length_10617_cov_4.243392_2_plen_320_part_00